MLDLAKFCLPIEQDPYKGEIESAGCNAIKFDDDNGFVKSLSKNYANWCRVDYFEISESRLILIELKYMQLKITNLLKQGKSKEYIRENLLANIQKKFTDSLEIIKQEITSDLIPTINYLVIDNAGMDLNIINKYLPEELGVKPFVICKTNEICDKLSALNTRCPE